MTMMETMDQQDFAGADDCSFALVGRLLSWLADHYREQPSLEEIAREAGMSTFHLQRLFTRYVGVSPKKYIQYLTLDHAKRSLDESRSVLDAAFDSGLSGPGRLHDLFVTHEALTPGEWKRRGEGVEVRFGWHDSPFGDCLIAATPRSVCGLAFNPIGSRTETLAELSNSLGEAELIEDSTATETYAARAFGDGKLHLMLRGTPFQLKVWEALIRIPPGAVLSYADLAKRIGVPGSARAVAGAVGRNPVSWLVPCHRVIRSEGTISGYRWEQATKRVILAWEAAQAEAHSSAH